MHLLVSRSVEVGSLKTNIQLVRSIYTYACMFLYTMKYTSVYTLLQHGQSANIANTLRDFVVCTICKNKTKAQVWTLQNKTVHEPDRKSEPSSTQYIKPECSILRHTDEPKPIKRLKNPNAYKRRTPVTLQTQLNTTVHKACVQATHRTTTTGCTKDKLQ